MSQDLPQPNRGALAEASKADPRILRRYRDEVLAVINTPVRNLWTGIESKAHRTIFAFPSPARAASCSQSELAACLYLPNLAAPTASEVCHELLHIQRYWIEGVPQLDAIDRAENKVAISNHIENIVEHSVIVPRQANYGGSRNDDDLADAKFFSGMTFNDAFGLELQALSGAMMLERLPHGEARQCVKATLKRLGKLNLRSLARQIFTIAPSNKKLATKKILQHLQIPLNELQWLNFDPIQGQCRKEPL
ncbi:hypothetical protein [Sphingobium subterraneum]|uniref:Uncharacterized protein n=1 Tax=Sphingobium subterraneum TaxID=627688 RepID=A0A841J1M3_9SPHN|nr:hypothetical protein [Sphingobium subterraneum]MBB6124604.1 hypothetical protein [Sphingobium subterraneum]